MSVEAFDTVLLRLNDGEDVFVEIVPQRSVRIKKSSFAAELLIGAPFGSVWEVGAGRDALTPVPSGVLIPAVDVAGLGEMTGDNRGYSDQGSAQALSQEDIERLKSAGADGTAVVAALARSSATFAEKNLLTQEKWLRKRTLKHVLRFRVVLPGPVAISEVLLERDADRVARLRWDALAHLLSLSGAREGCTAVVCDGTGGLLTAAVAHRMGCRGRILSPHASGSQAPPVGLATKFNLGRVGRRADEEMEEPAAAVAEGRAAETSAAAAGAAAASAPLAPAASASVCDVPAGTTAVDDGLPTLLPGVGNGLQKQPEPPLPQLQALPCTGNDHGRRFIVIGAPYDAVLERLAGATHPVADLLPADGSVSGGDASRKRRREGAAAAAALPAVAIAGAAAGGAIGVDAGQVTEPAAERPPASSPCVSAGPGDDVGAEDGGTDLSTAAVATSSAPLDAERISLDGTVPAAESPRSAQRPYSAVAAVSAAGGGGAAAAAGTKEARRPSGKAPAARQQQQRHGGGARTRHELPVCTLPLAARVAFFAPASADCCAIAAAADSDPAPLLLRVGLPLLRPSGTFAVFSAHAAPLAALQAALKAGGLAVHVQLSELWTRELQVLPGRTHPLMNMHGASGFVLAGVKVAQA